MACGRARAAGTSGARCALEQGGGRGSRCRGARWLAPQLGGATCTAAHPPGMRRTNTTTCSQHRMWQWDVLPSPAVGAVTGAYVRAAAAARCVPTRLCRCATPLARTRDVCRGSKQLAARGPAQGAAQCRHPHACVLPHRPPDTPHTRTRIPQRSAAPRPPFARPPRAPRSCAATICRRQKTSARSSEAAQSLERISL